LAKCGGPSPIAGLYLDRERSIHNFVADMGSKVLGQVAFRDPS